ncbi:hypothetical protein [Acinetobacter baumannii]|uniref:hypothetical protein n=1 Tax=Acinetobacter baumannii TaxID=470 RepID=UPI0028A0E67C|nr:hypothetical protein [Acinetobacter baumannii]
MTDLNKLRSEFEKHQHPKVLSWMFFDEENNIYQLKAVTINEDKFRARSELNFGWSMWQKAKAQAVPEQIADDIQSWIAVESIQAMELDGETFVVGANELAEFITQLVYGASESGAGG